MGVQKVKGFAHSGFQTAISFWISSIVQSSTPFLHRTTRPRSPLSSAGTGWLSRNQDLGFVKFAWQTRWPEAGRATPRLRMDNMRQTYPRPRQPSRGPARGCERRQHLVTVNS